MIVSIVLIIFGMIIDKNILKNLVKVISLAINVNEISFDENVDIIIISIISIIISVILDEMIENYVDKNSSQLSRKQKYIAEVLSWLL